jgi:hypothetical protein
VGDGHSCRGDGNLMMTIVIDIYRSALPGRNADTTSSSKQLRSGSPMKSLVLRFKTGTSWWLATFGLLLCAARNPTSATVIEYCIIVASISIAIVATVRTLDT